MKLADMEPELRAVRATPGRSLAPESPPDTVMDVFLHPGDFWFGDRDTRIRTLLGSCVSIVMWHPGKLLGGMCHYLMPSRPPHRRAAADGEPRGASHPADPALDGRYADDAMEMFLHEIRQAGTRPEEYVVKIFGGGRQFRHGTPAANNGLPDRNVEAGLELLEAHRLNVRAKHLGGKGHRQVLFEVWSGDVWMRHVDHEGS